MINEQKLQQLSDQISFLDKRIPEVFLIDGTKWVVLTKIRQRCVNQFNALSSEEGSLGFGE